MFKIIFLFLSLSTVFNGVHCSKLADQKIYKTLLSDFMCFRRFNSTHQFGCQSKQGGSVGTVHLVENESDIEYIINSGPNYPYIQCMRTKYFTTENIHKFSKSNRIAGLVLFDEQSVDKLPSFMTEDQRCPNEESSYHKNDSTYGHCKKEVWNQYAAISTIYDLDLDFPMVLIRDKENITNIQNCFNLFNSKRNLTNHIYEPNKSIDLLCSPELKTFMVGAKNSKVCISRSGKGFNLESVQFCDEVKSYNVFSTLFEYSKDKQIEERSIVVLASRVDSLSLFDNAATGASTVSTSLITLFSVMNILREQRENGQLNSSSVHNVLYSLFDGESLDNIGSGRTAYDLGTTGLQPLQSYGKQFDIKFFKHHLHSAIEISQATSADNKFYLHTDPLTRNKETITVQLNELIKSLVSKSIENVTQSDLPLPPSSVEQLLAHDLDLPVIVISNHKTNYVNKFYNSFLDDERTIIEKNKVIEAIAGLSESIAEALITVLESTKESVKELNLKADRELIKQLYHCLIEDSKCKFFENIRDFPSLLQPFQKTYPLYISSGLIPSFGPKSYHNEYLITLARLTSYLNGKKLKNVANQTECKEMNKIQSNVSYEWFEIDDQKTNSTLKNCFESTQFFTYAI